MQALRYFWHRQIEKHNNALQVTFGPLRVPLAPERKRWAS